MGGSLVVGSSGSYNLLTVADDHGQLVTGAATIGLNGGSANNTVRIIGGKSGWACNGLMNIGDAGPFNQLTLSDGGGVGTTDKINVGNASASNQLTILIYGRAY